MIGPLAKIVRASNLFKIVLRYFCKVRRKSIVCILKFDCFVALYLFISLICNADFIILKNSGVREELTDVVFFLETQLQQITVQEPVFCEFALTPLTFGPCTSPTDSFPFTYHFPFVSIPISQPLNCSPICRVEISNAFDARSISWIILAKEGVPIFYSHICFSALEISFGVEKLKRIFLSSSSVTSSSSTKFLKTQ